MTSRIGFIGLGAMGFPMARRLCEAGYQVRIAAHQSLRPIELLAELGARVCANVEEVVQEADIIITILPTDGELEAVLLSSAVMTSTRPGAVLIEMTSGSVGVMKRIGQVYANQCVRVLDAPVSGGTEGAMNGTLTVMVGGEPDVLDEVRPVLSVLASRLIVVGEVGAGKAIKAINQMLAGIHMVASAEAMKLAEHLGINFDVLREVIGSSSGSSWIFLNKMNSISTQDFRPGFKLRLMKKDIGIALQEGGNIPLPLANMVFQMYESNAAELGELDFSAVSLAPE